MLGAAYIPSFADEPFKPGQGQDIWDGFGGDGDRDGDKDRDDNRKFHLVPGSLIISSSIYDPTQGAVASLVVGTQLPDTATKTVPAVSNNNYVTVWNNAPIDGSFGITSPIALTDVDAFNGHVFHQLAVPTDQVVTSFSSKSELGLHLVKDWRGSHLIFGSRCARCIELRGGRRPGPDQSRNLCLWADLRLPPYHRLDERRRRVCPYADH